MCVTKCNKEMGREKKRKERSHLYVILWLSAFGRVSREQRLGGIKSWEVRLSDPCCKENNSERQRRREQRPVCCSSAASEAPRGV